MRFRDRKDAGRRLAKYLGEYRGRGDVVVLGLTRGGVPVAYEVAAALGAPMEPFIVRKLGTPGQEELAMGAIASGGVRVLNDELLGFLAIDHETIERVAAEQERELERREKLYRDDRPFPQLSGRTVILVDDGLATGSSMRAAISAVERMRPASIVVAVPVAAREVYERFNRMGDRIRCISVETPDQLLAVGYWYDDFSQTTDEEVRRLVQG